MKAKELYNLLLMVLVFKIESMIMELVNVPGTTCCEIESWMRGDGKVRTRFIQFGLLIPRLHKTT